MSLLGSLATQEIRVGLVVLAESWVGSGASGSGVSSGLEAAVF